MTKILFGTIALLFLTTLSTNNWSAEKKQPVLAKENVYNWHKYNEAGTQELFPAVTFVGTAQEAQEEFECPAGDAVICARAYDGATPLDIYITKTNP